MSKNTIVLLEKIRKASDPPSKNQLAKVTGIPRSSINAMYAGHRFPNALQCLEISRILHIELEHVLAHVAEDKAKTPATRKAARSHAPRLFAPVAIALAAVGATLFRGHVQAPALERTDMARTDNLYIMRSTKRRSTRILRKLWDAFPLKPVAALGLC